MLQCRRGTLTALPTRWKTGGVNKNAAMAPCFHEAFPSSITCASRINGCRVARRSTTDDDYLARELFLCHCGKRGSLGASSRCSAAEHAGKPAESLNRDESGRDKNVNGRRTNEREDTGGVVDGHQW